VIEVEIMTTTKRFFDSKKIGEIRRSRGWTQGEFSRRSTIGIDMVREYETGRSLPSVTRLMIIANTLECSLDDFTSES
jgi:transcriptional regulator with XRE-family HTH domain